MHCKVKLLKQRTGLREVTPEGCECRTPSLDSPSRLGGRSQPCALATVPSVFFLPSPSVSWAILTQYSWDSDSAWPRPQGVLLLGGGRGWGGCPSRVHAPNSASRPIRLQEPTPGSQSSEAARSPVGGAEAAPQTWGSLVPSASPRHPLGLASSGLIRELPKAGEPQAVLSPMSTGAGKDWSVVQPKRCLTAKGRVSRVPTRTRSCSVGRLVRARGPSGGSVRQDPQASGAIRPLSSLVWAGSALQQLSGPGDGWDKPAPGKGLLGPWPRAPPPALLWNLMI